MGLVELLTVISKVVDDFIKSYFVSLCVHCVQKYRLYSNLLFQQMRCYLNTKYTMYHEGVHSNLYIFLCVTLCTSCLKKPLL